MTNRLDWVHFPLTSMCRPEQNQKWLGEQEGWFSYPLRLAHGRFFVVFFGRIRSLEAIFGRHLSAMRGRTFEQLDPIYL